MRTKISMATLTLALFASPAVAADLPALKEPPVLPPSAIWTGAYFGANLGGIFDASSSIKIVSAPLYNDAANGAGLVGPSAFGNAVALAIPGESNASNLGVIGGGQIGYNWQFSSFLAGVETDIQGTTLSQNVKVFGSATERTTGAFVGVQTNFSKSLGYLGTVRGRFGYLVTPTLLLYGTAGLAYGGANFNNGVFVLSSLANFPTAAVSENYNDGRIGWAAGGGVEWMFMPRWSAKVEYLYYDLGTVSANAIAWGVVGSGAMLYSDYFKSSARINGNVVRAGVNYHFQPLGPAPVLAKY
nr:outer membrane beta-barrel protein [Methylocystis bryophila]